MERRDILLAGQRVSYTLKRSKRKSIGLRIDAIGLTVSMPLRASEKWLHKVLQDKAHWVTEKLLDRQTYTPVEVYWRDGENIPYLGELVRLRICQSLFPAPAQQKNNELWIFIPDVKDPLRIKQAVADWYAEKALQLFVARASYFSPLLNVSPKEIKLSLATTQWGCCTIKGTVRLNTHLIKLPLHLIDYVVVHELSHLREMNHSAAFWNIVSQACSTYKASRNELKSIMIS